MNKNKIDEDRIKYNLSDEYVEILSGVDYEVVGSVDCKNCILASYTCFEVDCEEIKFLKIHKTQESLNESIEKEELEKGVEIPDTLISIAPQIEHNHTGLNDNMDTLRVTEDREPHVWIDEAVEHHNKNVKDIMSKIPTHPSFDKCIFKPVIKETKYNSEDVAFEKSKQESKHYQNQLLVGTLHINTNKTSRIFDENGTMIWVKPPEYNPDDVAFKKPKQESLHCQSGMETIEKIDIVLSHLDGRITNKEAYALGNFIKYIDRLGLKDTIEKDSYKASDYAMMFKNDKWIKDLK